MLAVGLADVDQSVSNSEFECIVSVVLEEEQIDDEKDSLADGEEEEDGCSDIVEVLRNNVIVAIGFVLNKGATIRRGVAINVILAICINLEISWEFPNRVVVKAVFENVG